MKHLFLENKMLPFHSKHFFPGEPLQIKHILFHNWTNPCKSCDHSFWFILACDERQALSKRFHQWLSLWRAPRVGTWKTFWRMERCKYVFFVKMHFPLGFYHLKIFTNVSQDFKIFAAIMCLAMLDSLIFQSLEIYLELYLLIQVGNYSHQGKNFFLTNVHIAIICCQQFCSNTFCLWPLLLPP